MRAVGIGVLCLFAAPACESGQQSAPLTAAQQKQLTGVWLGTLSVGAQSLRLQLRLQPAAKDSLNCTMDSIDQKAFGIACADVEDQDGSVSFAVPAVAGKWAGKLATDGKALVGTWSQGGGPALPLTLNLQTSAIEAPKLQEPDAAMAPVSVDQIKAVLDKDLAGALMEGALAPATHSGVTIGVLSHGAQRVWSYGTANPDSVFEIGSITKTFTGLLLAQLTAQGTVRMDEPVRELLPAGTVAKPASGTEITLQDLSDQHSGLPRMPDNFHPANASNPYADYDSKLLYAFIAKHGVALPANAPFGYSNVGVGLLGQALANAAHQSYAQLLRTQIAGPLGMSNTGTALSAAMQAHFIAGYDAAHRPAHAWDLDALSGAGGIRSNAADMLTYLAAQLHPDRLPAQVLTQPNGKTLPAAIAASHVVRGQAVPGMYIALNWFRIDETGSYWHNGATGGYSSYALFDPQQDFALVVLSNTSAGPRNFTDALGMHVAQRLSGRPAISLAP